MAKRDRVGNPKPGSIRYEARQRGVTEARIRKERAFARGYSATQGRGHHEAGAPGIALLEGIGKFHTMSAKKQKAFEKLLAKTAKEGNMSMHQMWTLLLSPDKAGKK